MSEDEYGRRPGALPAGVHRPRPHLARWVRIASAIACIVGGVVLLVRGMAQGDPLWLWLGVGLLVVGVGGGLAALWMFRRSL